MRVTTDRTYDFHDLDALAKGIVKAGMSNEDKALACFDVVRWAMFQYPWVYNVKERQEEWHDATKLLNVYGHGLCGVQARTLGALYQKVFGYENQRLIGVNEKAPGDWALEKDPGAFFFSLMQKGYSPEQPSGHSCVEVFYDGHWHHLDPMVGFYCYTRDGSRIASLEETIADPTLVTNPSREIAGLMPDGDLSKVFYNSRFADWTPGPGYFMVMDTCMDVSLRAGQSMAYYWDRKPKGFYWPEIWAERFVQDYFDAGPRHPNASEGEWRHYGNGVFRSFTQTILAKETETFRLPYVLVGGTLTFDADSSTRSLCLQSNQGETRIFEVSVTRGNNKIDLRDYVMGGYGLDLCPLGGAIGNVTLELDFQHNFIVRPRLFSGANVVTVFDDVADAFHVTWVWAERGGECCVDERRVLAGDPYVIDVGELEDGFDVNPKYMKRLDIRSDSI